MKLYVGITDKDWYTQLSASPTEEVNFWNPGGTAFKALKENELFLFKLHHPDNYIVGGGFFVRFTLLPTFLAWEAFGLNNGCRSYGELEARIRKYRSRNSIDDNAQIGCTILTAPFWFNREDWIPVPSGWGKSIVRGKGYSTDEPDGKRLYEQVQERIHLAKTADQLGVQSPRYVESVTKHRLGQGAFRVLVTDAYQRRCAITGEKTLPVLEAAHIKSYADNGPHEVSNGILLKSDFHTLFDRGYVTITDDYHVEVSRRLNEDYGNGKDYYKHHGQKLLILPNQVEQMPQRDYLSWHNEHVYLG